MSSSETPTMTWPTPGAAKVHGRVVPRCTICGELQFFESTEPGSCGRCVAKMLTALGRYRNKLKGKGPIS